MSSRLRTVSWVLLALVGVLVLMAACLSAWLAYWGEYPVGGVSIAEIASGRSEVLLGLRGVRGTAAAWGAAWAALFLAVVVGPYRRGDVTTWWGILASVVALGLVVALRVPVLGQQVGTGPALVLLVAVILALLIDVRRIVPSDRAA
jgi:MFS family permease